MGARVIVPCFQTFLLASNGGMYYVNQHVSKQQNEAVCVSRECDYKMAYALFEYNGFQVFLEARALEL